MGNREVPDSPAVARICHVHLRVIVLRRGRFRRGRVRPGTVDRPVIGSARAVRVRRGINPRAARLHRGNRPVEVAVRVSHHRGGRPSAAAVGGFEHHHRILRRERAVKVIDVARGIGGDIAADAARRVRECNDGIERQALVARTRELHHVPVVPREIDVVLVRRSRRDVNVQEFLVAPGCRQRKGGAPRLAEIRRTIEMHPEPRAQRGRIGGQAVRRPADRGVAARARQRPLDVPGKAAVGGIVHLLPVNIVCARYDAVGEHRVDLDRDLVRTQYLIKPDFRVYRRRDTAGFRPACLHHAVYHQAAVLDLEHLPRRSRVLNRPRTHPVREPAPQLDTIKNRDAALEFFFIGRKQFQVLGGHGVVAVVPRPESGQARIIHARVRAARLVNGLRLRAKRTCAHHHCRTHQEASFHPGNPLPFAQRQKETTPPNKTHIPPAAL